MINKDSNNMCVSSKYLKKKAHLDGNYSFFSMKLPISA